MADMRVIAGKARRIPLKTIVGDATRPTTDRIKETLFNILQGDLYEIRFLDLFAGSGGIGIEALSRGASFACFVDQSRAAADCIRENLRRTRLADQAEVQNCEVRIALEQLNGQPPYQIVFMDPPYGKGLEDQVLKTIAERRPTFVDAQTLFILEMAMETDETHLADYGYEIWRVKEYKTNKHIFFTLAISKEEEL